MLFRAFNRAVLPFRTVLKGTGRAAATGAAEPRTARAARVRSIYQ